MQVPMAEWTEPPVLSVNATSVSLALITGPITTTFYVFSFLETLPSMGGGGGL